MRAWRRALAACCFSWLNWRTALEPELVVEHALVLLENELVGGDADALQGAHGGLGRAVFLGNLCTGRAPWVSRAQARARPRNRVLKDAPRRA
jgi:hypothetical protein